MGKPLKIRATRRPPVNVADEEAGAAGAEVNEDVQEDGEDAPMNDGQIVHLGRDLPDAVGPSEDHRTSDIEAIDGYPQRRIGEETDATSRATSGQLSKRNDGRVSTGKLVRVSRDATGQRVQGKMNSAQPVKFRVIGPTNKRQRNLYDPDVSPEKIDLRRQIHPVQPPAFSPIRKQGGRKARRPLQPQPAQMPDVTRQMQVDEQLSSEMGEQGLLVSTQHSRNGQESSEEAPEVQAATTPTSERSHPDAAQDGVAEIHTPARTQQPNWSAADDVILLGCEQLGMTSTQILTKLRHTDRSPSAVRSRLRALKLKASNEHATQSCGNGDEYDEDVEEQGADELAHDQRPSVRRGSSPQVLIYRDWFKDVDVPRQDEQEVVAGAASTRDEDAGAVAAVDEVVSSDAHTVQPQKRPRGRPPKHVDGSPASRALEDNSVSGRSSKKTTTQQTKHAQDIPQSGVMNAAAYEADTDLDARQTRARTAASGSPQKSKPQLQPKSKQKSSQAKSALEDLQRRRSGEAEGRHDTQPQTTAKSPVHNHAGIIEGSDPDDGLSVPDDEDDELPDKPIAAPAVAKIRASELYPRLEQGAQEDATTAVEQPAQSRKRKHKGTKPSAEVNTARKRQRFAESDAETDEDANAANSEKDRRRLCGQWLHLRQIYRNVKLVGCNVEGGEILDQNEIALEDPDVRGAVKLCRRAIKRYDKLRDRDAQTQSDHESEPAPILDELGKRVDGLRGRNEEFPTDFTDDVKSTNIYFHLIPQLVKLVKHAVECYEVMDLAEACEGQLTVRHLKMVLELIILILDLEESARRYKRPDTSYHVVQPVHNGIAFPLRSVHDGFLTEIRNHEHRHEERRRQEHDARDRERQREEAKRQKRQDAYNRRLETKWHQLHDERWWSEGGLLRTRKQEHLQAPSLGYLVETDQNGVPFERTEVFRPRIGPPPVLVEEANKHLWTLVELSTLEDGLREYSGPLVFEKIFRAYCGRGKVLNEYNVTEIVVTASILRGMLINAQKDKGFAVEPWMSAIPVWTNSHQALGKENEEEGIAET